MSFPILAGLGLALYIGAARTAQAQAPVQAIAVARRWLRGPGAFSEWRTASDGWAFTDSEYIEGGDRAPYAITSVTLGQNRLPVIAMQVGDRPLSIAMTGDDTGVISSAGRAPTAMRRHRTGTAVELQALLPSAAAQSNAQRIARRKIANDGRIM